MDYHIQKKDIPAISRWLTKKTAGMPPEAFTELRSCLASPAVVAAYSKFIDRWLDASDQELLYTTIRVARHRRRTTRKKNLAISQEAFDLLARRARKFGFKSVTAYVEHHAIGLEDNPRTKKWGENGEKNP